VSLLEILLLGVIAMLVGFIVLQRRNPSAADRIAAELDAGAKDIEARASAEIVKLTRKDK
jgi:hypothetical protein